MTNLLPKNLPPSEINHLRCLYQKKLCSFALMAVIWCFSSVQLHAQQRTITGKVISENNEGLPGVTVLVKGTTNGTSTDPDGGFSLNVPDGSGTLVVSFIGYVTQEVPINNRSSINISLAPDAKALEEVVVVGYGTQKRGTVTGAVSAIQGEELIRTPAPTTSGALVGKVPGVTTRQADSRPGGGANLQIRNMGDPLYVIDGIPSDASQFNNLGANDIENISVLKDASAAIYGLRAANGVVLVTTKKGKMGEKTSINLSGYYGMQNFTRFPQPANAYQYMRALAESDQNKGLPASLTPEILSKWQQGTEPGYRSTDYFDYIMRPNVPQYYLNANASGGSDKTNYFVSVNHLNQEALIKDYNFSRTNIQANLDAGIAKGLTVGTQISGRLEQRHQVGVPGVDDYPNVFLTVFSMWPTERPYANDNPAYVNQTHNVNVNPATYTEEITGWTDEWIRTFRGNFYAQYDLPFGLTAKGTYSYGFQNIAFENMEYTYKAYRYDQATDQYLTDPGWGNQNPWRRKSRRGIEDKFLQFQLNYDKQLGDHYVAAVAAFERQDNFNEFIQYNTFPTNNEIWLTRFVEQTNLVDQETQTARAGYISRINYNYKQKYLLELLGRYDGSYLYAPAKRWGFFPGVSVGWKILEEPFLKDRAGYLLNDLKLRASYGETGSEIGVNGLAPVAFGYYGGYDYAPTGLGASTVFNGALTTGLRPRGIPITNFSWVTNISSNVGLDLTMLDNKLTGSFDYFQRKRTGLPAPRYDVLLPSEVGTPLPNENLNSDANRGVEGALAYRSKAGNVSYSVGVNATVARIRLLEQYKPRFGNSWDEYRNGQLDRWSGVNNTNDPTNANLNSFGYQVVGQFQSQEEIDNYTIDNDGQGNRTQLPGDLIFKDVNGDKIINAMDERPINYALTANPYVSFGITTSASWKNFNLAIDFAGATMQSFQRAFELQIPFQNNGSSPAYMFENRWHHADPFNSDSPWIPGKYPAIRKDQSTHVNYRKSDFWVVNVSYIRMRNLELGYTIPQQILDRFGVSRLRVYANASNLFSIDNVKDLEIDPEISSSSGLVYPQQRLFNFGFNLSF